MTDAEKIYADAAQPATLRHYGPKARDTEEAVGRDVRPLHLAQRLGNFSFLFYSDA